MPEISTQLGASPLFDAREGEVDMRDSASPWWRCHCVNTHDIAHRQVTHRRQIFDAYAEGLILPAVPSNNEISSREKT